MKRLNSFLHSFPLWWIAFGARISIKETGLIETISFGWWLWCEHGKKMKRSANEL